MIHCVYGKIGYMCASFLPALVMRVNVFPPFPPPLIAAFHAALKNFSCNEKAAPVAPLSLQDATFAMYENIFRGFSPLLKLSYFRWFRFYLDA